MNYQNQESKEKDVAAKISALWKTIPKDGEDACLIHEDVRNALMKMCNKDMVERFGKLLVPQRRQQTYWTSSEVL